NRVHIGQYPIDVPIGRGQTELSEIGVKRVTRSVELCWPAHGGRTGCCNRSGVHSSLQILDSQRGAPTCLDQPTDRGLSHLAKPIVSSHSITVQPMPELLPLRSAVWRQYEIGRSIKQAWRWRIAGAAPRNTLSVERLGRSR